MRILGSLITFIIREWKVFLAFTWRDWFITFVPTFALSLGVTKRAGLPIIHTMRFIPWVTFYIYFFDLCNQITGIEEDRINKPNRPLPSGKVTLQGAKYRWAIVLLAYLSTAIFNHILLVENIVWIATTAFLCATPGGRHWFTKNNISMTVGSWSLLNGVWKTIAVPTAEETHFIVVVSVWAGIAAHIQDLRDTSGDLAVGRKTLPIVYGDRPSRWIISFVMLPLSCLVLWLGNIFSQAPFFLLVAHITLSYRVMVGKSARYDHNTYMIFSYLFGSILTFPLWCDL